MTDPPENTGRAVPPVARVVYLLAVAVALFAWKSPWLVGSVVALQLALWPLVGLPLGALARQLRKLLFFALAIFVTYALFGGGGHGPAWEIGPLSIERHGMLLGALMVLRVAGVILASQIARAGDPRAIAAGLRGLGLPEAAAIGLDAVLALLGEEEGGRGRGDGSGRGGGMGGGRSGGMGGGRGGMAGDRIAADDGAGPAAESGWRAVASWAAHLRRGDLRPLLQRLDHSVQRARRQVGDQAEAGSDLPVIVGIAVTMLGFKALKIMPGLPYAPGHKLILFLPLYVVAAVRTRGRWGASAVGLAMGFASFLMGDGKYGIFEVLKHLVPGIVCDLALPLYRDAPRGTLFWCVFGAIAGAVRFATEFAVIALAQPPAVAYALLLPGLASNLFFGFLSGYVTRHALVAVAEIDRSRSEADGISEVESDGTVGDRGRAHAHPIEVDAGISRQSRGGGAHRQ